MNDSVRNQPKAVAAEVADSAIFRNLGDLNDQLHKLREMAGMLADRLSPVLGPDERADHEAPPVPTGEQSVVSDRIRECTGLVLNTQRELGTILERVEL